MDGATSSARGLKGAYEAVTLITVANGGDTTGTAGSAFKLPIAKAYGFRLDVTDADTEAGDTLDVYIQTLIDGTNWLNVVRFTQILGNGADTLRYYARISQYVATAEFEASAAMTASTVRNFCGDAWRAYYVITDGGAAGGENFSFSVTAIPM